MNDEIACPSCDLLTRIGSLRNGDSAFCPRCGCFLTRFREDAYLRIVAFASAGLIFLILANSYPFLSLTASGLESVMTLRQTPGALWNNGMEEVAVLVAAFIIIIPGMVLLLLLALAIPLIQNHNSPWVKTVARSIFLAQNWSMAEVFIIGVIVALVKIAAMATVEIGISFWAYAAFVICFTLATASLDRFQCWKRIEALASE